MAKIIEKHHKYDETIFLPDLASCHYAKKKVPKASEMCLKTNPLKIFGLC
jgi:hypothetical protein